LPCVGIGPPSIKPFAWFSRSISTRSASTSHRTRIVPPAITVVGSTVNDRTSGAKVGVAVGNGVFDGSGVRVKVGVKVSVGSGVSVGIGVSVSVGVEVMLGVRVSVEDAVVVGVKDGVNDGVNVGVNVGVSVLLGVSVIVLLGSTATVGKGGGGLQPTSASTRITSPSVRDRNLFKLCLSVYALLPTSNKFSLCPSSANGALIPLCH
jgi:hypothetical protein